MFISISDLAFSSCFSSFLTIFFSSFFLNILLKINCFFGGLFPLELLASVGLYLFLVFISKNGFNLLSTFLSSNSICEIETFRGDIPFKAK